MQLIQPDTTSGVKFGNSDTRSRGWLSQLHTQYSILRSPSQARRANRRAQCFLEHVSGSKNSQQRDSDQAALRDLDAATARERIVIADARTSFSVPLSPNATSATTSKPGSSFLHRPYGWIRRRISGRLSDGSGLLLRLFMARALVTCARPKKAPARDRHRKHVHAAHHAEREPEVRDEKRDQKQKRGKDERHRTLRYVDVL